MSIIWITDEGFIGYIKKNEEPSDISVYAEYYGEETCIIKYSIESGILPNGIVLNTNGTFSGKCTTIQSESYDFQVKATAYDEDGEEIDTKSRTFQIITNKVDDDDIITWDTDEDLGTYKVGEYVIGSINAHCNNGLSINYKTNGQEPNGLILQPDGLLKGQIEPQTNQTYSFDVIASTTKTTSTKTFKVIVEKGLGSNSCNCYLKLNHENDEVYKEIQDIIGIDNAYLPSNPKYLNNTFPKVDIAQLHCFDRELLSYLLGVRSDDITSSVKVSVNPTPSNSIVYLYSDGYKQEIVKGLRQNYIFVPENANVQWIVKFGTVEKTGTVKAISNLALNIDVTTEA